MMDIMLTTVVSFFTALLLLKREKPLIALAVTVVTGIFVGFYARELFPLNNTSFGWLLSSNPELTLLYQQTGDILVLLKVAPYIYWFYIGFNIVAALAGYWLARIVLRRTRL